MIQSNHIIQAGDRVQGEASPTLMADELLKEISRLYVERCKALSDHNTSAVQLFTHQIDSLKNQLAKI